jgi:hypothetical protein
LTVFRAASRARSVREHEEQATADSAHLADARRLLDESVANADDATRESILANLRVNREIMAAWREHCGK